MMMRLFALLMTLTILCASCTALPAEERAFAVALCVERSEDGWKVHGRIPTYRSGGGYLTVTGEGEQLVSALADMEASAPMRVTLSQLRLLVLDEGLAQSDALSAALHTLGERNDIRLQCAVALTDVPLSDVANALQPASGERLSKAIDVLLESRVEQGVILPAAMADVLRMEDRQSAVLMKLTMEGESISLSGGYALDGNMMLVQRLSGEETALLSLLLCQTKDLYLSLPEGETKTGVSSVRATLLLEENVAQVEINLSLVSSALSEMVLAQSLADECAALLSRLAGMGCDVMGLGRQMVVHARNLQEWRSLDWPARLGNLQWTVSVQAEVPV